MYYPKTYFVHLAVLEMFKWTNVKATSLTQWNPSDYLVKIWYQESKNKEVTLL